MNPCTVDYEVVGVTEEGWEEYCASSNDENISNNYAIGYLEDYPTVRIYEVTKVLYTTFGETK